MSTYHEDYMRKMWAELKPRISSEHFAIPSGLIEPEFYNDIRVFDKQGQLHLFHFIATSDEENPPPNVRHLRGAIFDMNSRPPKMICCSQPYADELFQGEYDPEFMMLAENKIYAQDAYEGTVIRVFFYEGTMYISTHKKIDGRRSRWSSRETYGELFDDIVPENFEELLDKRFSYNFLLRHQQNKFVSNVPTNRLILMNVWDIENQVLVNPECFSDKFEICGMNIFDTIEELWDYVGECDWKNGKIGVYFQLPNYRFVKVINTDYKHAKDIRTNFPGLRMAWIANRNNGTVEEFEELFEEKKELFDGYRKTLENCVEYLAGIYNQRYYNGEFLTVSKNEHSVLDYARRESPKKFRGDELLGWIKFTVMQFSPEIQNALLREQTNRERLAAKKE